jgi:hypothetical protein
MNVTLAPADAGKARDSRGRVARVGRVRYFNSGAKVGASAGFVVDAADNLASIGRLPQSENGTLVVPISGLNAGSRIQGGHLVGVIESTAGVGTQVTWQLRKTTAVAANPSDALVSAIVDTLDVAADTVMGPTNTALDPIVGADAAGADGELVVEGAMYYALITGTTAASNDIDLLGVALIVLEEPKDLVQD